MTVTLRKTDQQIFHALCKFHFLTTAQLARYFGRHETAINRRLSTLHQEGYVVHNDRQRATDPYIWHPKPKAITALIKAGVVKDRDTFTCKGTSAGTKIDHQEHEIAISEIGLSLLLSARTQADSDVAVEKFERGPILHDSVFDYEGLRYRIRPDACIVLRRQKERHILFLEVDNGTKTLKGAPRAGRREAPHDVRSQLFAYTLYHQRGVFKQRYRTSTFRLLVVAQTRGSNTSPARRNNILTCVAREMMLRGQPSPGSPLRLYATLSDVIDQPFGTIFLRESDATVLGTLAWIEKTLPGHSLADSLPAGSYDDVRAAIPKTLLHRVYRTPSDGDDPIRNALIEALIQTGKIHLTSILSAVEGSI